jgi:hypothetical protein
MWAETSSTEMGLGPFKFKPPRPWRSPIDPALAPWRHRIHPPELLPLYRPNSSSSSSFDFRRRHGLRERQREGVAVIGRGLAALLHVGFRFQHQQVAPVDVIPRARQVGCHLLVATVTMQATSTGVATD